MKRRTNRLTWRKSCRMAATIRDVQIGMICTPTSLQEIFVSNSASSFTSANGSCAPGALWDLAPEIHLGRQLHGGYYGKGGVATGDGIQTIPGGGHY